MEKGGWQKYLSRERLKDILPPSYQLFEQLLCAAELMIHYRLETIQLLNTVADELDKRHHEINIAKVVSSAVGTAGTAAVGAGIAIAPFTLGAGLLLGVPGGIAMAAGGIAMTAGGLTAFASHLAEKVLQKVDLERTQRTVDVDQKQCKRVHELWKEFESYSEDIINTIALADPSEGSDIQSMQTWVAVGMETVSSPVLFIAGVFRKAFEALEKKGKDIPMTDGKYLFCKLGELVNKMAPSSFIKKCVKDPSVVVFTLAFLVIATLGVGNVFVLVTTLIDMHQGSLTKAAHDLRGKAKKLQNELDTWLEVFGNHR